MWRREKFDSIEYFEVHISSSLLSKLFSSHILSEVQNLCDRVVIINKGKIIAKDTVENLNISVERLKRMQKIANANCEKNLLIPTAPNSIYEVYIDHRIDGDPYLTVSFPL